MLIDVASLIRCLRSASWAWTAAALADLFRVLGLIEVGSDARQATRYFKASSGLACVAFADPQDLTPTGFEFPFPVPRLEGVSAADMLEQFERLLRISLDRVLGPCLTSVSWDVASSSIALEPRPGQEGTADAVVLVVRKRDVADREAVESGAGKS
jgi:hypothetical protein